MRVARPLVSEGSWPGLGATVGLVIKLFVLSSTGTNDFFSPFSVAGFSGYCSVLCSPHVPVSLISPLLAPGVRLPASRGQITRSGGRSLDCAPQELSRSRSVMASTMAWPGLAGGSRPVCCCHTSCHHTVRGPGPGMPHVTCQPQCRGI